MRNNKPNLTITLPKDKDSKQLDFYWITDFARNFEHHIQKPISLRQSIMKSSELQRCLTHNIIFSIYCTICRKVLCASCMYTSTLHRRHRVVPLEAAMDDIREDLKTFEGKIPKIIQHCDGIASANSVYLVNMEREFSPVIAKIQQFYQQLRSFLKLKEKEQLIILKEKKEEMRLQVVAYNKELAKIQQYIAEKFKTYANVSIKADLLVPARNILQNLLQAGPIIKEPYFDPSQAKFFADSQKIKKTLQEITYKVNQLVVGPVMHKPVELKPIQSARSVDFKMKIPTPTSKTKAKDDQILAQKKKRMNSSVAGARTIKRI